MSGAEGRLDGLDPFPSGWFQVAFSEDLPAGELKSLHYFGSDLVAYRGASGEVHVFDAYCPHLGAHLGFGGRVEGDDVVCPFHEWRFDRGGHNVEIPHASRPNKAACLRAWTVREVDGLVMVWHDREQTLPSWDFKEIWELSSPDFAPPARSLFELRSHPQEVYENAVDMAHFVSVHGAARPPEATLEIDGPHFVATAPHAELKAASGYFVGSVQFELWGLGIDVARISGIIDIVIVHTNTPVDDGLMHVRFSVTARRSGGDGPKRSPAEVDKLVRKAQERLIREYTTDVPIWEHKRYNAVPRLAPSERPITEYRRWARQFYRNGSGDDIAPRQRREHAGSSS